MKNEVQIHPEGTETGTVTGVGHPLGEEVYFTLETLKDSIASPEEKNCFFCGHPLVTDFVAGVPGGLIDGYHCSFCKVKYADIPPQGKKE